MLIDELHKQDPIAQELHLAITDQKFLGPDAAALALGLLPIGEKWLQVDRESAQATLVALLSKQIPFNSPRIDLELARTAAAEFIAAFGAKALFYTNADWSLPWFRPSPTHGVCFGPNFASATHATFDGGVLVLDTDKSGTLWVEDED